MAKDYARLLEQAQIPVVKRLYEIILSKQTNLCVSADLTSASEVLKLAKSVGKNICVLKTHVDIIDDFSQRFIKQLRSIADAEGFLLFEDRKFADIGNTVRLQASGGPFKITQWADFINAHTLPGPGIIDGLYKACMSQDKEQGENQDMVMRDIGLLLLAQMTSKDNLFTPEYQHKTIEMSENYPDFVAGWITNQRLTDNPDHVHFTTGVKITEQSDGLGQQYKTPQVAIENGADVVIVGRGVIKASDQKTMSKLYKDISWEAVLDYKQG